VQFKQTKTPTGKGKTDIWGGKLKEKRGLECGGVAREKSKKKNKHRKKNLVPIRGGGKDRKKKTPTGGGPWRKKGRETRGKYPPRRAVERRVNDRKKPEYSPSTSPRKKPR